MQAVPEGLLAREERGQGSEGVTQTHYRDGSFLIWLSKTTRGLLLAFFSGPPFTHQQAPRKMVFYGQTSCEQDTERYLDVVKYVFSSYKKEVPLLINTMGWVKGKRVKSVLKRWCRRKVVTVAVHSFLESPEPENTAYPA